MTITLTHPTDPSITWTSGARGKRPGWVTEILEANPDLLPKKVVEELAIPDSETIRATLYRKNEDGTVTLTHPTDSTITWTSGKIGKRPLWVSQMLEVAPDLIPVKEKVFVPVSEDTTPRLRYWRWNGLNDEDGKGIPLTLCIVGGMTPTEAVTALNKTMRIPVMPAEWSTCWKEISPESVSLGGKVGVFVQNKVTKEWEERKDKLGY